MPDWLAVVLLGVIEGITEFIPISSTGHLLIAERWLPRQSDLFNVVIQSGAVIAVLPLFAGRVNQVLFHWRERATQVLIAKIFVAFAITGAGGVILEKNNFQLPEQVAPVAIALIVGGILFIAVEAWLKGRPVSNEVTWIVAIAVGVGQLMAAIFPGASRSGTTILVAMVLGLSRTSATEFSFLVGIPTMLAAGGLKIFKAIYSPPPGAVPENWSLLALATVVSAVISFIAVKWLLRYVQSHTFTGFGWYRIGLGALILLLVTD